jgi:adenine-specific DNA-methyltransferase
MDQHQPPCRTGNPVRPAPHRPKNKLRITGPFSVEAVPFPTVLSLDDSYAAARGQRDRHRPHRRNLAPALWRDELLKTGVRGKGGADAASPSSRPCRHASCTPAATLADTGERVVVSFGPEHAALEQRQVELA